MNTLTRPRRTPSADVHGGDLETFAAKFRKRPEEILDFSSNVNPFGLPDSVRKAYLESAGALSSYPDPYARALCAKLAARFHIPSAQILAGNGSFALLDLAIRAIPSQKALLIEPCFSEYRRLLEMSGKTINSIPLSSNNNFDFPLDQMLKKLHQVDLLVIAHPNNPTGSALKREDLLQLIDAAQKENVFVMVDEAFVDWEPEDSAVEAVCHRDHVLVVRSFTKFYGLAGIRSGCAFGPESLIARMKDLQGPWTSNRLAQKLSETILEDQTFEIQSRQSMREEKARLRQALMSFPFLKVFPSRANFFLIQSQTEAGKLFEFLGGRGIYIRLCGNFPGLDSSYFRIAVRNRTDNEKLIAALGSYS